jgi:penicillin-binding protein 2
LAAFSIYKSQLHRLYKDAALSIQSRDVVSPATRGLIVDSSGVPLALNKVGVAITVDRTAIDKQEDKGEAVLRSLAQLLGLNYADVYPTHQTLW